MRCASSKAGPRGAPLPWVLCLTGFPHGTILCPALEKDLYAFLVQFAPVEHVHAVSGPTTGWIQYAVARFVHPTYAQAVLDRGPYTPFYGLYLSMELPPSRRTLVFRSTTKDAHTLDVRALMHSAYDAVPLARTVRAYVERAGASTSVPFEQEVGGCLTSLSKRSRRRLGRLTTSLLCRRGQRTASKPRTAMHGTLRRHGR